MFILYLKCAKPAFFEKNIEKKIGKKLIIYVKFAKKIDSKKKTDTICFQFIVSPHNPYWFEKTAKNMADLSFQLLTTKEPGVRSGAYINQSIQVTFTTQEILAPKKKYVRSIAFLPFGDEDPDSSISMQAALITNKTARYIVVEFNTTMGGGLRVSLRLIV